VEDVLRWRWDPRKNVHDPSVSRNGLTFACARHSSHLLLLAALLARWKMWQSRERVWIRSCEHGRGRGPDGRGLWKNSR